MKLKFGQSILATSLCNLELSYHTRAQQHLQHKNGHQSEANIRDTNRLQPFARRLAIRPSAHIFTSHTQHASPLATALTASCTCYAKNGSFARDLDQLEAH